MNRRAFLLGGVSLAALAPVAGGVGAPLAAGAERMAILGAADAYVSEFGSRAFTEVALKEALLLMKRSGVLPVINGACLGERA